MHILLTCDLQKKKIFFKKISKDHSSEKYTLNVHGYFVDVYFKNVMTWFRVQLFQTRNEVMDGRLKDMSLILKCEFNVGISVF